MSHDWPLVESRTEYETTWYDGGYDRVEQPDGTEKQYYWADLPPAVVVVAVDDNDVLFVDQYRPTIRKQCMELVAGIVEEDTVDATPTDAVAPHPTRESYVAAGRRELREETGFEADTVTLLEEFWTATGVLRHKRGIVFAEDLTATDRDLDDNEFLSVERVPVAEALTVARTPPANDATIEGLLLADADGHL
ncbi:MULTISPECIES: NUDIX hydrolase [Halobacterium]|uniref:NUDIX hydrolase n=1 Tax=Halobacterium TaxID=2239 RepID=UPI001962D899|nr:MULTISPECIES: NUDIX hydrolase [Halobacterium]MDL0121927.1 NUDIX hydrolase [Halobacterium salinarum]MDL0138847.1 NUDIX hydrolase [Halobacterium salinarum]QRY24796.1 NUDIX hydrolase [Halobacterium sp. BOL4-2]